jgi:hypothetical protein
MDATSIFSETLRERIKVVAESSLAIRIGMFSGVTHEGRIISIGHDYCVLFDDVVQTAIPLDRIESFTCSHHVL